MGTQIWIYHLDVYMRYVVAVPDYREFLVDVIVLFILRFCLEPIAQKIRRARACTRVISLGMCVRVHVYPCKTFMF